MLKGSWKKKNKTSQKGGNYRKKLFKIHEKWKLGKNKKSISLRKKNHKNGIPTHT